jgi:membrane-bound lytic murein transglycosylase MltF
MAESNLKYNAKSSVGALGLMQFMPATWTSVAPEPYKSLGAMDPESAIWVGCKYLRWNWERVPTETVDDRKAFTNAAYNSGLGWTLKARQKCRSNPPCDANLWTNNVELNLVTNPRAQEENRRYVVRIRQFEQQLLLAGEFL